MQDTNETKEVDPTLFAYPLNSSERFELLCLWIHALRKRAFREYHPANVLARVCADDPRYLHYAQFVRCSRIDERFAHALGLLLSCAMMRATPQHPSWLAYVEYSRERLGLTPRHLADVLEHQLLPMLGRARLVPRSTLDYYFVRQEERRV